MTIEQDALPPAARRVAEALREAGHPAEIRVVDGGARTAEEAAAALGVETRLIVKSMVFRGGSSDRLVLVVLAGDRRVDLSRVAAELGEAVERAEPNWVRERTGFAIGGIPPLAHSTAPTVVIDRALRAESVLWAGAGTPDTLFRTSGPDLERLTGGVLADVGTPVAGAPRTSG